MDGSDNKITSLRVSVDLLDIQQVNEMQRLLLQREMVYKIEEALAAMRTYLKHGGNPLENMDAADRATWERLETYRRYAQACNTQEQLAAIKDAQFVEGFEAGFEMCRTTLMEHIGDTKDRLEDLG